MTGVDPVDRSALVSDVRRGHRRAFHQRPLGGPIEYPDKADVVIEAVGHQVATPQHAVEAAAFAGTVFYFGVPDDDCTRSACEPCVARNLTLKAGDRRPHPGAPRGRRVRACPSGPVARLHHAHTSGSTTQAAFELAAAGAGTREDRDRPLSSRSRLQMPLAGKRQCVGGWVVGPTAMGPGGSTPGYDHVGSDTQHGYPTTPTWRPCCADWNMSRSPPRCDFPAAPAPIGRVLDAGADAVVIALVETPSKPPPLSPRPGTPQPVYAASVRCGRRWGQHRGTGGARRGLRHDRDGGPRCRHSTRSARSPGSAASTSVRPIWRYRWATAWRR